MFRWSSHVSWLRYTVHDTRGDNMRDMLWACLFLKGGCGCSPWHIGIHSEYAVQEDNDAQDRWRDEELGINTQPGKIQPNLLSKVLPVQVKTAYQRAVGFYPVTTQPMDSEAKQPLDWSRVVNISSKLAARLLSKVNSFCKPLDLSSCVTLRSNAPLVSEISKSNGRNKMFPTTSTPIRV